MTRTRSTYYLFNIIFIIISKYQIPNATSQLSQQPALFPYAGALHDNDPAHCPGETLRNGIMGSHMSHKTKKEWSSCSRNGVQKVYNNQCGGGQRWRLNSKIFSFIIWNSLNTRFKSATKGGRFSKILSKYVSASFPVSY